MPNIFKTHHYNPLLDNCKYCGSTSLECKYCKNQDFYRFIENKKKMKANLKIIRIKRVKILINSFPKQTYWCNKHESFHKYKYKGNTSKTWLNCLKQNSNNFSKFKKDMKNSEILHLTLNKSLKRYSIDSHKKTIGSMKQ